MGESPCGFESHRPHQTTRIRARCRATDLAGIDAVRSDRSQAGRNAETGKNVPGRGLPSDGREAEHEHGEDPERALWRLGRIWLVFCRLFMTARRRSRHRGGQGPARPCGTGSRFPGPCGWSVGLIRYGPYRDWNPPDGKRDALSGHLRQSCLFSSTKAEKERGGCPVTCSMSLEIIEVRPCSMQP